LDDFLVYAYIEGVNKKTAVPELLVIFGCAGVEFFER
jgi:hypothetical protein